MTNRPESEMREWGIVRADELERIVVISPHLDDAVLGCAHLMAAHPGVTVISVFTGRPATYPDPMGRWDALCGFASGDEVHEVRRAEDVSALATLGAVPRWLGFVEHSYLDESEWVRGASVADALEAGLREVDPTAVVAPFGLGNPDHDATHVAAMLVRDRLPSPSWFCYEDTGYKHIPGLLAWRIARLFVAGTWPTPVAMPVDPDRARKAAALACYPSQLRALEAEWQVGEKLAAPAPEQFWRLAPPPPGWERLADPAGLGLE